MNREQIALARQRLERCEQIDVDLVALDVALSAHQLSECSFRDWNTGRELLSSKALLREVIDIGLFAMIRKLESELESIRLEAPLAVVGEWCDAGPAGLGGQA